MTASYKCKYINYNAKIKIIYIIYKIYIVYKNKNDI